MLPKHLASHLHKPIRGRHLPYLLEPRHPFLRNTRHGRPFDLRPEAQNLLMVIELSGREVINRTIDQQADLRLVSGRHRGPRYKG